MQNMAPIFSNKNNREGSSSSFLVRVAFGLANLFNKLATFLKFFNQIVVFGTRLGGIYLIDLNVEILVMYCKYVPSNQQ